MSGLLRRGLATAIGIVAMSLPVLAGPAVHRTDLSAHDRRRVEAVTAPTGDFSRPEPFEAMSAGAATLTGRAGRDAFSQSLANLDFAGERDFKLGNGLFRKLWVAAPASTQASDGLGPLFNARSCQRCHLKDGRGHPPEGENDPATSMFLRLSVPPRSPAERQALADRTLMSIPDPVYGGQLQDFAVAGLPAEGRMRISYEEFEVALHDGETATLRRPRYRVDRLGYGPMDPEIMVSPRVAPPMIGLGLIEAIHPGDILGRADPDDLDGDGISGRASMVRKDGGGELAVGRFGWKGSNWSVRAQTAAAFAGDMGISTDDRPDAWGDCTARQQVCRNAPNGVQARLGASEAPAPVLDLVTFYARNLTVPARRGAGDPTVLRGKALFYRSGCTGCHTPKYVTARDAAQAEHRFQLIWPYSDLLLHDMGEGLADGRPVGDASGSEWRTPPLWGIGLTATVSGHSFFLHDGRARSLLEAVLWHGGEAKPARDRVVAMDRGERAALIAFLQSL